MSDASANGLLRSTARSGPIVVTPSRNLKSSERIARQLVDFIIENDLAEGTLLSTERDLVESFSVGRTTIREALRLLETRGVISIRSGPHGGPVVRRPRPEDLREALTLNLQFSETSHQQVLEAREALESMLARLAAERVTVSLVAQLRETVDDMRSDPEDHARFLRANHLFHGLVAEAGSNTVLRVFSATLMAVNDGALPGARYDVARRLQVAKAHEKVILALEEKNAEKAGSTMRAHIRDTIRYWNRRDPDHLARPIHWLS